MLLEELESEVDEGAAPEDDGELAPLPTGVSETKRYFIGFVHRGRAERRGLLKDDWNGREMTEILEVRRKMEPWCCWFWIEKPRYEVIEQPKGEM